MTRESPTEDGAKRIVRDFAEGFSLQSKLANRTWIVLVTLIIFSMQTSTLREGVSIKTLPFGFGTIEATDIDTLMYFVISIVTISFCALFAQTLRIYDTAHSKIDCMSDKEAQRLFFDILSTPTLWRVGPLAIKNDTRGNVLLKKYLKAYYYVLRVSAELLMLGIPLYGIVSSGLGVLKISTIPVVVKISGVVIFFLVLISIFKVSKINIKQIIKIGERIGENQHH